MLPASGNNAEGADGDTGHPQETVPFVMGLPLLPGHVNGPAHRLESPKASPQGARAQRASAKAALRGQLG